MAGLSFQLRSSGLLLRQTEPVWGLSNQQRTIALSRESFEDVVETQRENRQLLRQGIGDAREVVERAGARVPQFLRRNRLVASRDGDTASPNSASPDK